jgi:hypothetical protein
MSPLQHSLRNTIAAQSPGLLLQPFGWAASSVMQMARAEPRLLAHLTDLDKLRLHSIVLYLAHRDQGTLGPEEAVFLASARSRDIVEGAIGNLPRHLFGLLRRLPACALERDLYKSVVTIAANEEFTGALMGHSLLTSTEISRLGRVPSPLCSAELLNAVHLDVFRLAAIAEVCDWLEYRCNIDAVSRYLSACSLAQVRQVTLDLMRTLPPLPVFPPRSVGTAHLIETAEDLRRAGRVARNCLGRSTHELTLNQAAFYVWQDDDEPIYIRVNKPYGLGWFLSHMKLGENRPPTAERVELVEQAFCAAGIDKGIVGDALLVLLFDPEERALEALRD